MNIPFWLLRLLPLFEYICPKCRKNVKRNAHCCLHCGEKYPLAIRVPPSFLKDPKKLEAYVHKHIFPKVSKAHREYLSKFFTELFNNGFEEGNFSAWTGTTINLGTIIVEAVNPHHGTYNAKSDVTGANGYALAYKSLTSANIVYIRVYVKFEETLTTDDRVCEVLAASYGATYNNIISAVFLKKVSGTVYWAILYRNNAVYTWAVSSSTPTTGTFYCVELKLDCSTTDGTSDASTELWINDVSVASAINFDSDYIGTTYAHVGRNREFILQTEAGTSFIDCVMFADAPIGPEAEAGGQPYISRVQGVAGMRSW
jgi:hypothetical protein